MLSDNIQQCGSMGENVDNVEATTPFNTKFTILKFNSDNKKVTTRTSAVKLSSKKKARVDIFKQCRDRKKSSKKLLDFNISESIMGKGIFKDCSNQNQVSSSCDAFNNQGKGIKSQRTDVSEDHHLFGQNDGHE